MGTQLFYPSDCYQCLRGLVNYRLLGLLFTWSVAKNGFTFLKGCKQKKTTKNMQQRAWTASLDDLFFPLIYRKGLFLPGRQTGTFLLCSGSINWKHKLIRTHRKSLCCCCLVAKSCPTLLRPRGLQLASSSVHGISQARTLEWAAISSSRGPPHPGIESASPALAGRIVATSIA